MGGEQSSFQLSVGAGKVAQALKAYGPVDRSAFDGRSTTYYDTFDWRLFGRGLVFYRRKPGEPRSLVLGTLDGTRLSACETSVEPSFVSLLPRGSLRKRLASVVEVRRLFAVVTLIESGSDISVLDQAGKTVVRLSVRDVAVQRPDGSKTVRLRRILTLRPVLGYEEDAGRLIEFLKARFTLDPVQGSDLEIGLAAAGVNPADASSKLPFSLEPGMPALQAAGRIAEALAKVMLRNQEGVARDLDSEFLHDFRVAVRRTRSLLSQTRKLWPAEDLETFRREFKWLGNLTGPTRDLDVYLLRIERFASDFPDSSRKDLSPLIELLGEERQREFSRLKRGLRSKRYRDLVRRWSEYLADIEKDPKASDALSIESLAARRIWKAFRRVLKRGRGLDARSDPETVHRLRIECKKLRYLLEFFRGLFEPAGIRAIIDVLKGLQDDLGEFNDLSIQMRKLESLSRELLRSHAGSPSMFLLIGRLVERLESRQKWIRQELPARFAALASEPNPDRLRSLLFGA